MDRIGLDWPDGGCGAARHRYFLTPYWERAFLRSLTPAASSVPRTTLYRTPGRSLTRPPRTSTTECSCRLWPSPGMYVVTSIPLVSRTRATLRSAEFGFLGVVVYTRVHTPRRCGAATRRLRPRPDFRPGVATFFFGALRPLRTSWEVVGMRRTMLATKMRDECRPSAVTVPPDWTLPSATTARPSATLSSPTRPPPSGPLPSPSSAPPGRACCRPPGTRA